MEEGSEMYSSRSIRALTKMIAARRFLHSLKGKLEDWFSRSSPIPEDSSVVEGQNNATSIQSLDIEGSPSPTAIEQDDGHEYSQSESVLDTPHHELNRPNNFDWTAVVLGFCLTSAVEIALQSLQPQIKLPLHVNLLSLAMVFAFCFFFFSNFISPNHFPRFNHALIQLGKLSIFLVFFLAITVPFSYSFKILTWSVFVLSLLLIIYVLGAPGLLFHEHVQGHASRILPP